METSLRRYTELPYLIDFLTTKEIVLLNPASWDDRNDSYYIEKYAERFKLASSYALCLTEGHETYHHWRVFSHGSSGVCIEFDKASFVTAVTKIAGLRAEPVVYKTIDSLNRRAPLVDELPFLKRYAFIDEKEFRLFHCMKEKDAPIFRVPIPLSAIKRITLSPWLSVSVSDQLKKILCSIDGCNDLNIYRSTLVENKKWKKFAEKIGTSI